MRLSIIVPVYNVEKYLEKCVSSLLHQGVPMDEYEIILIDDGSDDGSGSICDRLALLNQNIIVIHQKNRGLSEARNVGLRVCRGDFIQFVDSDDYLEENVLPGLLYEMEEKQTDILRFQVRRVFENTEPSEVPLFEFSSIETQNTIPGSQYLQDYMGYACYACQFLFRASFLLSNELLFKPGIIFEDTEWTPRVMSAAKSVSSTNTLVYNYLEREGSITSGSAEKRINGQLLIVSEMKKQLSLAQEKKWHRGMIAHMVVSIITCASTTLFSKRKEIISRLEELDVFPLLPNRSSTKGRRKILLINMSPKLACSVIHLFNI